jgi:hypothetical protein
MKLRTAKVALATLAAALTLVACSSNEQPSEAHPVPASAKLFDPNTGLPLPEPYTFVTGVPTRVEVVFYDANGDNIDADLISAHFTSIVFTPSDFATVSDIPGSRFERDITPTVSEGTTATFMVGYGHDALADENAFGPYAASAVAPN